MMFTKLAITLLSVTALSFGSLANPLPFSRQLAARTDFSFNGWHGISSLNNFDSFYGADNFDNSHLEQMVVAQQQTLVCQSQSIEIIQQRLTVIMEMAKRIITEQICEVETQVIAFSQFHSSLGHFSDDLRRRSGRHVGFDSQIASHFNDICNSDGSLSNHDLGFSGHDVGSHTVVVGGSNWNDQSSPAVVDAAFNACSAAIASSD
ncbi:hypothetical protein AX16_008041 [Volvariella volvacea WC 439]|nr:hypothetical protein AX16_008041 [Volvariella volvacea WC 439]